MSFVVLPYYFRVWATLWNFWIKRNIQYRFCSSFLLLIFFCYFHRTSFCSFICLFCLLHLQRFNCSSIRFKRILQANTFWSLHTHFVSEVLLYACTRFRWALLWLYVLVSHSSSLWSPCCWRQMLLKVLALPKTSASEVFYSYFNLQAHIYSCIVQDEHFLGSYCCFCAHFSL